MESGRSGMKQSRILLFLPIALLGGCGLFSSDDVEERAIGQAAEKAEVAATDEELVQPVTEQIGTPMAERVATLGFLNKRNGLTRDLELRPGQSVRIGRAIVRLRACERTAPWELTPEQGAFVQLLVNDRPSTRAGDDEWKQVFSGWLFRESPSLNVVEHPIYDVWVKRCEMSFPGEENPPEDSTNPTAPRSSSSNAVNLSSSAENDAAGDGDTASSVSPSPAQPPVAPVLAPTPAEEPEDLIGDLIAENTGDE
ncbi:hypothetical protein SAMN02745824_1052 [Parasphingorhabdus marina DSM 22363]|uniref:DUF2155 domain-containing protein n=1 Tax=Parasphingorhabdus marina DSM 22363 TaxID=1123272 RepID=A0A1N6CV38_9SPHN|nr:hypothetical protein SAMN02745824_1052 [Parasphingorhabdus marina DSM 22363]